MTNALFNSWDPFTVDANGTTHTVDDLPWHEGLEYSEDGRTLSNTAGERCWTDVTGLSGQHGYDGPIMHPSEFLSADTVEALAPGVYQCVLVDYIGDDADPDDDDMTIGWALMRYTGNNEN